MKVPSRILWLLLWPVCAMPQANRYHISFDNAVHHEALISVHFENVPIDTLEVRMSRSSPGRYALHEFAKNVYGFEATNDKGEALNVHRTDPYSWKVSGHRGTVHIRYTLFADQGDGTYSQIDETHAHLNMPATFMYAPALANRPFEVTFEPRADLQWKVATQLPLITGTTYAAPNLQYFMDSPTEISDFSLREFELRSNGQTYTIALALHHQGSEVSLDTYFEQLKKVVQQEMEVFGELPDFDYGRYTFLACYMPQVSGDGMEHRNSTILTSTRGLEEGGMAGNIGTVSHEFFHAWNVERLRPGSLEPFGFEAANMSGELWFAEGFTSYYTNLILCRAGIISPEAYVSGLNGTFNYVWNSPGRMFHNPIEMSYQAPFVDAATSIDPQNKNNTFISYYSYGSMLGLALDLSLREQGLSLDGYMRLLWDTRGRKEAPYLLADLHNALNQYAGKAFGDHFFESYIYHSGQPDYRSLFDRVGISLNAEPENAWLGLSFSPLEGGSLQVQANALIGSPAYLAGLERGDIVYSIDGKTLDETLALDEYLQSLEPGNRITLGYKRRGQAREAIVVLGANPARTIRLMEASGKQPSPQSLEARKAWLNLK